MKLTALLFLASVVACEPTVYLIRHGEKPADGSTGLNPDGEIRAQCVADVFGSDSDYEITHIMAQAYKKSGKRKRPYDTVLPLANALGISVDTSCDRDDHECVARVVENYEGPGDILICWEHKALDDLVEAMGAMDVPEYPKPNYGLIWKVPYPYKTITGVTNENCPGLGP